MGEDHRGHVFRRQNVLMDRLQCGFEHSDGGRPGELGAVAKNASVSLIRCEDNGSKSTVPGSLFDVG